MTRSIDLNADMGESYGHFTIGHDGQVMPLITSASLACGFHGGDPRTMALTVELALEHGVAVGAHPGLPDLEGFGRRHIEVTPEETAAYITYQLGALDGFVRSAGSRIHHVKLHGAFAAAVLNQERLARAAAEAIAAFQPGLMLYVPAPIERYAATEAATDAGLRVVSEAYVDLRYEPDGSLKVIKEIESPDPETVAQRAVRIATEGVVDSADGGILAIEAETICVHGDNPAAPWILSRVREELDRLGMPVRPV